MHIARWIILSFLILTILISYDPFVSEHASLFWGQVRPDVIEFMDGAYAAIRNFVAGSELHKRMEDNPPGVNYDLIITMDQRIFL